MYQKDTYRYTENNDFGVQIAHRLYESESDDAQFVLAVILPPQGVSIDEVERKLAASVEQ